jgi:hypothetical protein
MIEDQCRNSRQKLPNWLIEKRRLKPRLAFGLDFFYEAFWNLCTERVFNEVVLNLAWSKIQEYADYYGMDFEESEQFHYLIKKMDEAYVKQMRENGKPKQDKSIEPRRSANGRSKADTSKGE